MLFFHIFTFKYYFDSQLENDVLVIGKLGINELIEPGEYYVEFLA